MNLARKLLAEVLKGMVCSLGAALGAALADRVLSPPDAPERRSARKRKAPRRKG